MEYSAMVTPSTPGHPEVLDWFTTAAKVFTFDMLTCMQARLLRGGEHDD